MKNNTRDDETTAAARRLAAAMAKLGKPISHTQALTALAATNGDTNRHIAAAKVAKANHATPAEPAQKAETEPQDRPDSYRFEAAMADGVAAMMQAFSRHGYRLPKLCDEDEVGSTLAAAFERAMDELFAPPGIPEPSGTRNAIATKPGDDAAQDALREIISRDGYLVSRQALGTNHDVIVSAWLPAKADGCAAKGGCVIAHQQTITPTTLSIGRGVTRDAAAADAVANMDGSRFLLRFQRTQSGVDSDVHVEAFGTAMDARRAKNALIAALPARCRMDWQIIRRDGFCAIDAGYAYYDDGSTTDQTSGLRPTGSDGLNTAPTPTPTRQQATATKGPTPEGIAKRALSKLIDSIAQVEAFEDLEGGCDGHGAIVEACEAIGIPLPEKLVAWFRRNDPSYGEAEGDDDEDEATTAANEADETEDDDVVPSAADQRDFVGFCRNASDRQVIGIREKERDAGRTVYSRIAEAEGRRRGIDMG